jgi:hypothetical protein
MKTLKQRFREKVLVQDGCWQWIGGKHSNGYGKILESDRSSSLLQAHRVSWAMHHGSIPDGMCVLHKCDNRECVNPDHLWLGTRGDNNTDRHRKGRSKWAKGEESAQAKLSHSDVINIRVLDIPWRSLAGLYGVNRCHIQRIKHKQRWAHI